MLKNCYILRLRRETYEHYANDETGAKSAKKIKRYARRTC